MATIQFVKIKGEWAVRPDDWDGDAVNINTNDDPKTVHRMLGISLSVLTEAYGKVYKAEEAADAKAAKEAEAEAPAEEKPAKKKHHKKK